MKRLMLLVCTLSVFIFSSCSDESLRRTRMEFADALARYTFDKQNEGSPLHFTPGGQDWLNSHSNSTAAAASERAARLVENPLYVKIFGYNIRIPDAARLPLNRYEADGDMHNDAIAFIIKQKAAGVDVLGKLMNKDRETIDMFFKLNPNLQEDNARKEAVDALIATEVPFELKSKITTITYAKDYEEGISYLDMTADEKALVKEVFATCNNYYVNEADFGQVAEYINGKISSLLNKGKDMTIADQRLACMFTIFKHSYYCWHVAR